MAAETVWDFLLVEPVLQPRPRAATRAPHEPKSCLAPPSRWVSLTGLLVLLPLQGSSRGGGQKRSFEHTDSNRNLNGYFNGYSTRGLHTTESGAPMPSINKRPRRMMSEAGGSRGRMGGRGWGAGGRGRPFVSPDKGRYYG